MTALCGVIASLALASAAGCGSDSAEADSGSIGSSDEGIPRATDAAGLDGGSAHDGQRLDAERSEAGADTDDAGSPDGGPSCVVPPVGSPLVLDRSTRLCGGVLRITPGPSEAAVRIVTSGITIECEGTIVSNALTADSYGTSARPTIGFLIEAVSDIQIKGCGARGFRYGLVARFAQNLLIDGADMDSNFDDPSQGWVQDTVQGGGIRFDHVSSSVITHSTMNDDWNGIELRWSDDNLVSNNIADHCSNWAAALFQANRNQVRDNSFRWSIRGAGLSYPDHWYRIDTKDSAGIVLDAESNSNLILRNTLTYGGDGVFIRSLGGGCATDNLIQDNDTSFSPHNAIECWCAGNQFVGNTASWSDYGLWLGGTDRGLVRGNRIEHNLTDGISIQIGQDRHTIIDGNAIRNNGRSGILLTGREIQSWQPLDRRGPELANSSHLIIQRNDFMSNGSCPPSTSCDVFVAASRGVLIASNCGGQVHSGAEAEGIWSAGSCGTSTASPSPNVVLGPVSATIGREVRLDASRSSDPGRAPLNFHWLVQRAGRRFVPAMLPEAPLLEAGAGVAALTFTSPGLWDVDVIADNGATAGLAWRTIAVAPAGLVLGGSASAWTYRCTTSGCMTTIVDDPASSLRGSGSVSVTTNEAFPFALLTPSTANLGLDPSRYQRLAAFFRAKNPNPGGWQGNFPTFVLGSASGGTVSYEPNSNLLPTSPEEWIYVDLPLGGGNGWTRTVHGGPLQRIDYVEIDMDTWDYGAYTVWIDALTLY